MKKMIFGALSLACGVCLANIDRPDVLVLGGTGYHTNGWFTFGATVHSENDSLLFDNKEEFVLSPRYDAPIRKVVIGVRASSDGDKMTRTLWVRPFADGIETSTNDFACTLQAKPTEFTNVSFDFSLGDKVDAVRICLGESGSGNWRVGLIMVFYGEKGADEDELLRSLARELPSPANLRAETFTTNSLTLVADEVVGASGYRFAVDRLVGLPRTVNREDFVMAPALSAGWSYGETNHVSFGQYTGTSSSSYPDNKTSLDGGHALQIIPDKKGVPLAQIVSPEVSVSVTECSYVCKASSSVSDQIRLYGRTSVRGEWIPLGEATYVTTSKAYVTNAVPVADGIRQVMFEFSATGAVANCGLDTLRIVYGGNETHATVRSADVVSAVPTCALDGLEANARYAFRVQAVADPAAEPPCRDSSWTEEQIVDLSWASATVAPPTDVAWEMNGAKMTVRWTAVAGADHYLVDVVPSGDPEHPVVSGAKAMGTSLEVTVPSVGEYTATVTAVSPGGISKATSEPFADEVELGTLASVTLKAVERQAVEASWSKVPLAEGYQAKLIAVDGTAETFEFGWPVDEGGRCTLPDGWTCDSWWRDPATANTWTNNHVAYPALPYGGSFLASGEFSQPITKLTCAYKCGSSSQGVLDNTRLVIAVKTAGGSNWTEAATLTVATATDTVKLTFAEEEDVRQIRLTAVELTPVGSRANVRLGKLTVVTGSEMRHEVESVRTAEAKVSFRNLDPNGRYAVTVVPLPSEGEAQGATSPVVDLSVQHFRKTGAVLLSQVRAGAYVESFDSLSNVSAKVETRSLPLDCWQLHKGSGETDAVLYSSKTNFTTGGVYALSDEERTPSSFMLGTLAAGTYGCAVGIAFLNDTDESVDVGTLSFDAIQRTVRKVPSSYRLEWTITDGATGIDAEGEWQALAIPETAPHVVGDSEAGGECRQAVEIAEGLPPKLPCGCVLILRWRHEKVASGPAMGIDNVKVEFGQAGGFRVFVR